VELTGRDRRVAREILTYLVKHPEAKDSLAGIHNWWLQDPDQCSDKEVRRAAEALVERGLLSIRESSPGSVIFGPTEEFLRTPQVFLHEFAEYGDRKQ
jgi:hypothetical protein